ncbi:MAG TPA: hypothetical protein VMW37_04945 [Dehalococcoidales bacterium]|nr:hypothetical protein [Dehalococcoidales bacterium]
MKLWQGLLLVVLLAALPVLSACELFGSGTSREQQAYEEQLEAYREYQEKLKEYQEQREAYNREVIEIYNEQLKKAYKQYEEGIETWQEERQKQWEELGAE